MLRHTKLRRFPTFYRVARRAFSAIGTLGKLARVRIGTVTTGTFFKRNGPSKVAAGMTFRARKLGMLPKQWKLRLAVVESAIQHDN